jgi:DNA-directed RNA polymerase subunit RPC12/RpoP
MSRQLGRELRRCAVPGYICAGCGELWTLVNLGSEPIQAPTEVGCPKCWGELVPVAIANVNGRSYWYLAGGESRLPGKVADDPACDAVT